MKLKGIIPRTWRFLKKVFIFLFFFHLFYILLLRWVNPPITITQLNIMVKSWFNDYSFQRDYVDMEEISIHAKLAVIASEDQLFADHGGFDWKSIEKAMDYNEKKPGRSRGASTISQQVAKNVFLWQGKSYLRKGLEVYFTKMIELVWGKKRILEVYLNVIEMGEGVIGIEAAAQKYFKKPAAKLSKVEAAKIAACLPNPVRFTVVPPSKRVSSRYPFIMRQMSNLQNDAEIQAIIQD
jgi:monofunctional biosynthetic peptidoglycan transglycosylase